MSDLHLTNALTSSPTATPLKPQIFPTDGYAQLYAALAASYREGRGAPVRGRYRVLPNKWKGVRGGYDADVLWLVNSRLAAWEAALPAASAVDRSHSDRTRAMIRASWARASASISSRNDAGSILRRRA